MMVALEFGLLRSGCRQFTQLLSYNKQQTYPKNTSRVIPYLFLGYLPSYTANASHQNEVPAKKAGYDPLGNYNLQEHQR